jgi:hypothetical protein
MRHRTLRHLSVLALVVVVGIVADFTARVGSAPETNAAVRRPRVSGGAASIDELLARFLEAIRAKDRGALEEIRFTEDEYRHVILPGHVKKGEPPQRVGEKASQYFYAEANTKSFYHRESLLHRFGGKAYTVKSYRFLKGVEELAGYTAYWRLALTLADETGNEVELRTGSIGEVDGRFKFASYIRDD